MDGDLSFAAQVDKPDVMLGDFADTGSIGAVDTEIIDDHGSDTTFHGRRRRHQGGRELDRAQANDRWMDSIY